MFITVVTSAKVIEEIGLENMKTFFSNKVKSLTPEPGWKHPEFDTNFLMKIVFNEKSSICNFLQFFFDIVSLVMNISMWE